MHPITVEKISNPIDELSYQKKLTEHYLSIQNINQSILDDLNFGFLTPFINELLSNQFNHPCFGTSNTDLTYNPERNICLLGSAVLFGISGIVGGLFFAVPVTAAFAFLIPELVSRSISKAIGKNIHALAEAEKFYEECVSDREFRTTYSFENFYSKAINRVEMTKSYIELSKNIHRAFTEMRDSIPPLTHEHKEVEHIIVGDIDQINLLVIDEMIIENNEKLSELYSIKGVVSEAELLSTIKEYEDRLSDATYAEKHTEIEFNILPSLRKALSFQRQ